MATRVSCPKCGSADVRVIRLDFPRPIGGSIAIGVFGSAAVDHHVCTACGLVETYVSDRETLDKIKEKWPVT